MGDLEDKGTEVVATNKGKELLELKPRSRPLRDEEITPSSSYEPYPEALASYQEVIENTNLFMETLEKLHFVMKTKFMIPTIGGKELDLHRLFIEVTSRGGIQKLIADRRWREVTNVFNFPSTATNASFVLRKYYISLLRHYEQIYYFEAKSCSIPSTVSLSSIMPTTPFQPDKTGFAFPSLETQSATRKRRKGNGEVVPAGNVGLRVSHGDELSIKELPANQTVAGVIDGKFEDGYFVTVVIGNKKLRGVLFHPSQQNVVQEQTELHGPVDENGTRVIRRRRKRKKLSSRDPTHPKPNRSGYNFFFAEQHSKLKLLHPGKDREISKMIGDLWNNQTETERAVYQEIGLKDKQRYQTELAAYKEQQKTTLVLSNEAPVQPIATDPSHKIQNVDLKLAIDTDMLSDCTETEGEKSEYEPGPQNLSEFSAAAAAGMEPACLSADHSAYELRRRDGTEVVNDYEMVNECALSPSGGEDVESGRTARSDEEKN